MLFFIAILIGGRGSIMGPMLGTIILTMLPEFAAPLAAWSTFLYAVLLLVIVLAIPGGIAALLDFANRRPLDSNRAIVPRPAAARRAARPWRRARDDLALRGVVLAFGGVRAIDGLDLDIRPAQVHGLIGPNGCGKTTTLNVICGYYQPHAGAHQRSGRTTWPPGAADARRLGIARTFQTPRVIGEASVLQNVMIGGTIEGTATLRRIAAGAAAPPARRARCCSARRAARCGVVGLESLAAVRADRLQHSELRFIEIARALMLHPRLPAARRARGRVFPADEIERLGELIKAISRRGTGVLLVEHHADLIFDICDQVTVLNLGSDARRRHAGRNPRAQGGGQCLSRRLNRCCVRRAALRRRLRQDRRAARRRPHDRRRRGRGAARPQRRRQDHAAARAVGTAAGGRPAGALRRPRHRAAPRRARRRAPASCM